MSGAPTPQVLLEPIASDADPGFITNPLPDAPTGTNAASIQGGYPPIVMTSELAGGKPPLGQDENGFLFLLSSHSFFTQCGQLYRYSAPLATAIAGYSLGAILGMADGTGAWLNTVDGNTTDPDAGGAGWVPGYAYGNSAATGLTGGVVTLTPAQAKYQVIVLSGVLTSNLIVNLPETNQEWLIVNATSGAFVTKVQTAAAAAFVTVPQGGFASPTQVYGIGDGNIYPRVAPLSVPIDQAPTANTLAERTNTGALLATVFNSSEGATSPTITYVIVDAGDGNFQKISLAEFAAQLFPQAQIIRAGQTATLAGGANRVNFPTAFPNSCTAIVVTPNTNSATVAITARDRFGFNINTGAAVSFNYIATGT